jgi:hypothetical protein
MDLVSLLEYNHKFVPEKAIKEYETDKNTKLHSWFLLFYVIISITLMLVVLIKLRHK